MNLDVMKKEPHWSMTMNISPHGTVCTIFIPSMQFQGWGDTVEQAIDQAFERAAAYYAELERKYYDI